MVPPPSTDTHFSARVVIWVLALMTSFPFGLPAAPTHPSSPMRAPGAARLARDRNFFRRDRSTTRRSGTRSDGARVGVHADWLQTLRMDVICSTTANADLRPKAKARHGLQLRLECDCDGLALIYSVYCHLSTQTYTVAYSAGSVHRLMISKWPLLALRGLYTVCGLFGKGWRGYARRGNFEFTSTIASHIWRQFVWNHRLR